MRFLLVLLLVLASGVVSAAAQTQTQSDAGSTLSYRGPDLGAQRAAIERLSGLVGQWSGAAEVTFPAPRTIHQTERVERAMDGLLLLIHGRGFAGADRSGAPLFNAFGVISYDDAREVYEVRAYNEGRAVTAEARFLEDGRFQWTMNFSPVIVRYTLTIAGGQWREVGEMSRDNGATWERTVEIDLVRVE
ncbi:MAG: hypothetical protein ACK4X1_07870 [Terricaulis sp.]